MTKLDVTFLSDDVRRLVRMAKRLFVGERGDRYKWVPKPAGGCEFVQPGINATHDFYKEMERRHGEGLVDGAFAYMSAVEELVVERQASSCVLKLCACKLQHNNYENQPLVERHVADFGVFAKVLTKENPKMLLDWIVDMNTHDPEHDLIKQPTALPRGILFACDHRVAASFWESAAAEPNFPDRIFSDPCAQEDGEGVSCFSPFQIRNFSTFFSVAPDAAFERFSQHLAKYARNKLVLADVRTPAQIKANEPPEPKYRPITVPMTDEERTMMLSSIGGHMRDRDRRIRLHAAFGLAPPK